MFGNIPPVLICSVLLAVPASGATLYVPDNHPTIQGAIAASSAGDVIVVRAGTYVENLDFLGKAVTVMSESGAAATVVDGSRSGSVVTFRNGEDEFSRLQGFTITNGSGTGSSGPDGGGIYCLLASPTIEGNLITGNRVTGEGGSTLSAGHSDVEGGQGATSVDPGSVLHWGAGMIDTDPLFCDPAGGDHHLTRNSPCLGGGDNAAVAKPCDFEGDPRIAFGTVDLGADEFYFHLYAMGTLLPGSPVTLRAVGLPAQSVTLFLGAGIADPPHATQHGDFRLDWPVLWTGPVGTVPANGVRSIGATIPSVWPPGSIHPFQALLGHWGGVNSRFTNLLVIEVE